MCQEVLGGVIGEAYEGGDELLVQHGGPQETRHLLLFSGIARERKGMAQTGKDKAGDAAFKWGIEGETSHLKGEDDIAMMDFDVVWSRDRVDVLRIKGEGVERSEELAGRAIGGGARCWPRNEKKQAGGEELHRKSVVIFSIKEQGCGEWSFLAA